MNEEIKTQGEITKAWGRLGRNLAIFLPDLINKRMETSGAGYPFVVKATPVLIVILSLASIATIDTRVMVHHNGWNSPLIAFAAASMVPIATLFAALTTHKRWSALFWVVSFFFAALSGSIQYGVYAPSAGSNLMMFVEAAAFGFGLPVSEVLMAIMEAVSINEWRKGQEETARKAKEEAAAAKLAADLAEAQEEERAHAEAERLRKEDLQRQHEEQLARIEAERLAAIAKIEIEKAQAEAAYEIQRLHDKNEEQRLNNETNRQVRLLKAGKRPAEVPAEQPADNQSKQVTPTLSKTELGKRMVIRYSSDPQISDQKIADAEQVTRYRVQQVKKLLVDEGIIKIESNGNGLPNTVSINGHNDAFMDGQINLD